MCREPKSESALRAHAWTVRNACEKEQLPQLVCTQVSFRFGESKLKL